MVSEGISVWNLETSFQRTPLRKLWGTLSKYSLPQVRDRVRFLLDLADIEVLESTEPYPFPIAQLDIPFNKRESSVCGVLLLSARKFLTKEQDFDNLVGKRMLFEMTPGHPIWNQKQGKEVPSDCWEIIEVKGIGSVAKTPTDRAVELLLGHTEAEFSQAFFKDEQVRKGEDAGILQKTVLDKQFIPALITNGIVVKDANGVYQPGPSYTQS